MIAIIIIIGLGLIGLGMDIGRHGELKTDKHDAWITLITLIITWSLYYWAGLFDMFIK